jgi:hypothetical protein
MKTIEITKDYFDIELNSRVRKGSLLTVSDERAAELVAKNIATVFDLVSDPDEYVASPKWIKFTKSFTDIQTEDVQTQLNLKEVPPKTRVHQSFVRVTELFETAEGQADMNVSLGINEGGQDQVIMSSTAINNGIGEFTPNGSLGDIIIDEDGAANVQITTNITITPMAEENLQDLTAGEMEIYLLVSILY